jgi:hypothetical protein
MAKRRVSAKVSKTARTSSSAPMASPCVDLATGIFLCDQAIAEVTATLSKLKVARAALVRAHTNRGCTPKIV